MKSQKAERTLKSNSILWSEATGFSIMILLSWLTEWLHIPNLIFGESFTPNWHRAVIRTVVILLIWGWVHWITRRLLKRLHHLEEFLRICGWCRKVCDQDQWLTMEDYFNSKFATRTSHGMCPECLEKAVKELEQNEKPATNRKA
ncbi:MAG: hypothetical protein P4N60_00365 [Verrucomicrobiae bacterium]|nr:hypothetical protein [Verrucomicrobiae bacterium]